MQIAYRREAMKTLAIERRRFGYRRIHVMLDRQGIVMNLKKPYRGLSQIFGLNRMLTIGMEFALRKLRSEP